MVHRLNGDLANDLGNLCQRVYVDGFPQLRREIPITFAKRNGRTVRDGDLRQFERPALAYEAQAFHQALELIWRHVADANRYVDELAPWNFARVIRRVWKPCFILLAEGIRNIAILASPFIPDSMDKVLETLGGRRRDFDRLGLAHALTSGTPMPGKPQPIFPRLQKKTTDRPIMLVDSHCHLTWSGMAISMRLSNAPATAASGTMVTICTKVTEFSTVRAIAERYDDVWCTVGIHPHDAANEPAVSTKQLVELAQHPKVIGIGETGLGLLL